MKKIKNSNSLIISSIVYFSVFFLIPLTVSSLDVFTKDFMWHPWYMLVVFTPLSVVFIVVVLKIFGFSKKRFFSLMGIILFSWILSMVYIYIRFGSVFENFRSSSF